MPDIPVTSAAWIGHDAEYGHCAKCGVSLIEQFGTDGPVDLPTHWIGGRVLGSMLDYPERISLIIETPDGTVVRVKGVVEVVTDA